MKKVLVAGIIVVLSILVGIFVPDYYEPTTDSAISTQMVVCASAIKLAVEEKVVSGKPLPNNIESMCEGIATKVSISESGELDIENSVIGITFKFIPKISGTKISWSCKSSPKESIPKSCI